MTIDDEARELWKEARTAVAGTSPQRGEPASSPVGRYLDPLRHERETDIEALIADDAG